jgi:glycosyltransferase involved in cell wall biosynthesis
MKIYYLSDSWPWFGTHQCYGRIVDYVKAVQPEVSDTGVNYSAIDRIIGRAYAFISGNSWRRDNVFSSAEVRYLLCALNRAKAGDIHHILFFDTHYPLFKRWVKSPKNIIATIHHPQGRAFPYLMEDCLKRLSSAIVMYSEGVEYFEQYVGKGRVKFIHYGVDTKFFCPRPVSNLEPRTSHLLYTGQNGRNLSMLKRVIPKLAESHKDIYFDILVPARIRLNELRELDNQPRIAWHAGLSENAVRELYQNSYLLLMPMTDSGVNTAIVEAMACGLPIVTTGVGGVRDYGGGSIYPIVKNDDDDAMIDLVEQYLAKPDWRNEVGRKCREFAEENLSWPVIAEKHLEAYRDLASGSRFEV